jgi:hypothetical protein
MSEPLPSAEKVAGPLWSNLDYPHMTEGWAFPTPEGREHYFRDGRSFCGRHQIAPGARIAGRMDYAEDPCVTCDRVITAEMRRLWCEHGDPRDECPDCAETHPLPPAEGRA